MEFLSIGSYFHNLKKDPTKTMDITAQVLIPGYALFKYGQKSQTGEEDETLFGAGAEKLKETVVPGYSWLDKWKYAILVIILALLTVGLAPKLLALARAGKIIKELKE